MGLKVSVITPCLNSGQTIKDTIESVLNQTYKEIEYIIVDGMSTDNTMDIIKKYEALFGGRLRYISEKDEGIYDAMNKGIAASSGDVIGIINSDDWYEPDAVERAVKCFESTNADVAYGEIWVIDENGQREYHTSDSVFPPHPSTFIKRKVYQKYGMFDLNYRIASDRELLLRIMEKGVQLEHISGILANFRKTGISNTYSMECARETYEIDRKYLGRCPQNILNEKSVEEKYSREKLLYISYRRPEAIKAILSGYYDISKGVVIFGAGACGGELEMILRRCHIPVYFFADNEQKKWGLELKGKRIFSPEILRYDSTHVIVTVTRFQEDICNQLQGYNNPCLTWSVLEELREKIIKECNSLFSKYECKI